MQETPALPPPSVRHLRGLSPPTVRTTLIRPGVRALLVLSTPTLGCSPPTPAWAWLEATTGTTTATAHWWGAVPGPAVGTSSPRRPTGRRAPTAAASVWWGSAGTRGGRLSGQARHCTDQFLTYRDAYQGYNEQQQQHQQQARQAQQPAPAAVK